jgi:hypothetical protein
MFSKSDDMKERQALKVRIKALWAWTKVGRRNMRIRDSPQEGV